MAGRDEACRGRNHCPTIFSIGLPNPRFGLGLATRAYLLRGDHRRWIMLSGSPVDRLCTFPHPQKPPHARPRSALTDAGLLLANQQAADVPRAPAASPPREGRAMWNHSGTGAYPGDWERSAKLLAENGFNMILPNMLWGGVAHYPSDVLPRSAKFRKYGDQIEQCCAAAKRHGIEVHVWKVNYNLHTAPKDFVAKLRREGRTQLSNRGEPCDWLCPSHPDNRRLELESMLEVARKYPVDGLHFDYIRYPDRAHCYCDGCRRRFEAASGRKVLDRDWPKECFSGDGRKSITIGDAGRSPRWWRP